MSGPDDSRHESEELLRRALLDAAAAASVALKVQPLATCDALTIVFHGRRDLGTIQTYVAHGGLGAGTKVGADALLRVPCDLDLGHAGDRDEAEELYGDYVDLVETGTELLADLRDNFAATLGDDAADEYEAEFNRAVAKRLPRFALEIENR